MSGMNKSELTASVAERAGITKGQAQAALDAIFSTITDQTAAQAAFACRNRLVLKADHALRQRHLHFARHNRLMDFRAALAVMTLTDLGCVLR